LYCDILFRAEGKPIFGHKCIVFPRCPQLRTLYAMYSKIAKGNPNEFIVDKIKYNIFLAILYYLYTDHVKVAPHLYGELAITAKKLKLDRLEKICRREEEIPPSTFQQELSSIVNDTYSSDIGFELEDKLMTHAHKMLIASRSEYFKTIFESGFKEHSAQVIAIEMVEQNIFNAVLQYLYTGDDAVAQSDRIVDILIAADRFLLDDLKQICESILESSLDTDNCAYLLAIADKHNAPRLKRLCLETILKTWHIFKQTSGFALLPTMAPKLLREVDHICNKHELTTPGEVVRAASKIVPVATV